MASVTGLNITDMKMQPDVAVYTTEFHDTHQHRHDSNAPQDTDVFDVMKDLDYEWNTPNSFYAQNDNADYARLSAPRQSTEPAPILPWKTYNHLQHTNKHPPLNTKINFQNPIPSTLSSEFSGTSSGSVTQTMVPSRMTFNCPSFETQYPN